MILTMEITTWDLTNMVVPWPPRVLRGSRSSMNGARVVMMPPTHQWCGGFTAFRFFGLVR